MELCSKSTLNETWDCLKESNGEYLPFILMAECFLWLFDVYDFLIGLSAPFLR